MAVTYATNQEVRYSYPEIDNLLPTARIEGAQDGTGVPLSSITVNSTRNFPQSGSFDVLDSNNDTTTLTYTNKNQTTFFLSATTALAYDDDELVHGGSAMLDHFRSLAKAWVDSVVTNPNVPTDFRKDLEIHRVFVLVGILNSDPNIREWATQVSQFLTTQLMAIKSQYPAKIRQTIAKLAEEDLSDYEIDRLKYGPSGDQ